MDNKGWMKYNETYPHVQRIRDDSKDGEGVYQADYYQGVGVVHLSIKDWPPFK